MIPPDLHILHLSDLHINNGVVNHTLSSLLSDITGQLLDVKNLIIVVTGDVVAGGGYDINENAAIDFFSRLKNVIPSDCHILSFVMAPGNHDVVLPDYKSDDSIIPSSERYEKFQERVNEIFNVNHVGTFGVSNLIFNQRTIRIVRTDTSCNSRPEDVKKLIMKKLDLSDENDDRLRDLCGKRDQAYRKRFEKQTKELRAQMDKCWAEAESCHQPVALSIVLSHMPLTWLQTDGDQIKDVLFKNGLDDVDIWLCGHAHRSQLYYTNDDGRSVLMLMTGIGRKENASWKQRYSIYRLGMERNACAVKVRVTDNGTSFETEKVGDSFGASKVYDYSCFPLRNRSASALLRLNTSREASAKGFCFDDEAFALLRELSVRVSVLRELLSEEATKQIELVLRCLDAAKDSLGWDPREVVRCDIEDDEFQDKIGIFTKTIIECDALRDLLSLICSRIVETLSRPMPATDFLNSEVFKKIRWRAHFRKYANTSLNLLTREIKDDSYYACTTNDAEVKLKPLPWNDFLAAVYNHKEKSMVFSACDFSNKIDTDWDDFLTAIPDLYDNKKAYKKFTPVKVRPLLTFGLSLKGEGSESQRHASRILYLLEYLNLNGVITHCIEKFVTKLPMDFEKVVKSIKGA